MCLVDHSCFVSRECSDVYCPNCGESGHHIDFPVLCRLSSTNAVNAGGEASAKKKHRAQSAGAGNSRHPEPGLCMEPKYDAFVRFPQRKYLCQKVILFALQLRSLD